MGSSLASAKGPAEQLSNMKRGTNKQRKGKSGDGEINNNSSQQIVDVSPVERSKVVSKLEKLLEEHNRQSVPVRIKRSASQVYEFEKTNDLDSYFPPTKVLSDIKLIKKVGYGTFGSVWKAKDLESGEIIAVKKMIGSSFPEQVKFLKEAEILRMSNHPNVLRFVGLFVKKMSGEEMYNMQHLSFSNTITNLELQMKNKTSAKVADWEVYLCTEFCKNGDLSKMLRNQRIRHIPWLVRMSFALDISKGLKHLHSMKIVHRDIKGENVLLKPVKKISFDAKNLEKTLMKQSKRLKRRRELKERRTELETASTEKPTAHNNNKTTTTMGVFSLNKVRRKVQNTLSRRKKSEKPVNFSENVDADKYSFSDTENADSDNVGSFPVSTEVDHNSDPETDTDNSEADNFNEDEDAEARYVQNMLNSRAILADVGLARFFKASVADKNTTTKQRQERLTIRGNPWTMAPELLMSATEYFTTACDVFSLGVVFFEIATRLTASELPRRSDDLSLDFEAISDLHTELDRLPIPIERLCAEAACELEFDLLKEIDSFAETEVMELGESNKQEEFIPRHNVSKHSNSDPTGGRLMPRISLTSSRNRASTKAFDKTLSEDFHDSFNRNCPQEFQDLATTCCSLDPFQRPTASEIVSKLEKIVLTYKRQLMKRRMLSL